MGMAVGSGQGTKSEINMTPLIDVLLVLLIIFMVITPQVPVGLDALVPLPPQADGHHRPDNARAVVISIGKDNSLLINQERTLEQALRGRLEEIFKTRAERVVFVKGDPDLEFESVARVIETAHAAGIDKVALYTARQ